jgi:hypothetical protein
MATSYKDFLKSKPLDFDEIRTEKRHGELGLVWNNGRYRPYRHGVGFVEERAA